MEEERSFVVFEDEEGNEIELDIIDEFAHENRNFAVLMDLSELLNEEEEGGCECSKEGCAHEECNCADEDEGTEMYVMEVVQTEGSDEADFLPVEDEELLQSLTEIVYKRIMEGEE